MRTRPLALILPILALLILSPPAARADASNNAALRYWRGLSMMSPELETTLREARADDTLSSADWDPSPELIDALDDSKIESIVHEFLKGARLTECDFGPDREDGIELLLPHLGGLRFGVTLLLLDARMKLSQGDPGAAAERFAAAYAVAAHSASDRIMVSSLVSASLAQQVNEALLQERVLGALRPEDRKTIALAAWRFPSDDPFLLRQAIANEGSLMESWLRREFVQRVSEQDLRTFGQMLFDGAEDVEGLLEVVNDEEAFEAALVRMRIFYAEVDAAWDAEDADERLQTIEAEFDKDTDENKYGILTELFAPAITRCRINERKAAEALDEARAKLGG